MNDEEASSRTQSPHDETVPRIRTVWYEGKLHFSLIDIVAYLKVSKKPARSYWAQLKDQVQNKGFRDALTRTVKLPLKAAVSASERPIAQIGKPCCASERPIATPKAEPIEAGLACSRRSDCTPMIDNLSIIGPTANIYGYAYLRKGETICHRTR